MHGYLPTRTPLTQKGQIVPPSKMASPDESRANTLAYTVVCTADEGNGPDTIASGGTFSPAFSTGDGPWTITVTVNNTGTVPITLGGTVTEAADPDAAFTKDDASYGGELQPSNSDAFTVDMADTGSDSTSDVTAVAKASMERGSDGFLLTEPGSTTHAFIFYSSNGSEVTKVTEIDAVAGYDIDDTGITVDSTAGLLAEDIIHMGNSDSELIRIVSIDNGTDMTVERAYNGTTGDAILDNQEVFIIHDDLADADNHYFIDLDSTTTAANVMAALETVLNGAAIGVTSDDGAGDGTSVFTATVPGWTIAEYVNNAGFLATTFSTPGHTGQFTFVVEGSTFTLNFNATITA